MALVLVYSICIYLLSRVQLELKTHTHAHMYIVCRQTHKHTHMAYGIWYLVYTKYRQRTC